MKIPVRGFYVALVPLLVMCFVVGLRMVLNSREPAYQGKSLTTWLRQFEAARLNTPTSTYHLTPAEFRAQFVEPTQTAIRHMGTNTLPTLLTLLRAKDSPLQLRAEVLLGRLPFVQWRPPSADLRRSMALTGFYILGTNAQGAVP